MLPVAVITEKNRITTKSIDKKKSFKSGISESTKTVKINEILPFRIRFTDVRLPGYNSNNIPGIGLQIIGYSNYIL